MKMLTILIVLARLCGGVAADNNLPVLKSNSSVVTIRDGNELRKDYWTLAPDAKPDVYEAELIDGVPHKVTFTTDVDSISFTVAEGKRYDFIIQRGADRCHTQIVGCRTGCASTRRTGRPTRASLSRSRRYTSWSTSRSR